MDTSKFWSILVPLFQKPRNLVRKLFSLERNKRPDKSSKKAPQICRSFGTFSAKLRKPLAKRPHRPQTLPSKEKNHQRPPPTTSSPPPRNHPTESAPSTYPRSVLLLMFTSVSNGVAPRNNANSAPSRSKFPTTDDRCVVQTATMSASSPRKDPAEGPKRPPEGPSSPTSPSQPRLRDRVSFFEKVWTGGGRSGVVEAVSAADVEEFERRLAEERSRNLERNRLEQVTLRHTPTRVLHTEVQPDGSIQARLWGRQPVCV